MASEAAHSREMGDGGSRSPLPPSSNPEGANRVPLLPVKYQDVEDPDDGYHQASFGSAVFNLSTTIVGAGIMALPATMKVLGLPLGLLAIVVAGILTDISIQFMDRYSVPCKARSYGGLMADSFGQSGRTLTQLFIIINNSGILIVYLIIIGDVLSGTDNHTGILTELAGGATWWNSRGVVLFATTLFILVPLVSLRHVDSLKHSSALSMALAGVFLVITVSVAIVKLVEGKIGALRLLPDVHDMQSFGALFTVVPVMVTAYICHNNRDEKTKTPRIFVETPVVPVAFVLSVAFLLAAVHPIANELKGPIKHQMLSITRAALVLCSTIYVATALFGYLLFGEKTDSDFLSNFDADLGVPYSRVLGDTVRISYAVHIMLVFPLLHFSLRLNVDAFLFPRAAPLAGDTRRFAVLTTVLMGIIFFGSAVIPDIYTAIEFTGSTASVCLGFIFPAAIALRDAPGIGTVRDKILASVMVVSAVVASISAITSNSIDLFVKS